MLCGAIIGDQRDLMNLVVERTRSTWNPSSHKDAEEAAAPMFFPLHAAATVPSNQARGSCRGSPRYIQWFLEHDLTKLVARDWLVSAVCDGDHVIHVAVRSGNIAAVEYLLSNFNHGIFYKFTRDATDEGAVERKLTLQRTSGDSQAIHIAAMMNDVPMIRLLAKYGADLKSKATPQMLTPLKYSEMYLCAEAAAALRQLL